MATVRYGPSLILSWNPSPMERLGVEISTSSSMPARFVAAVAVIILLISEIALCAIASNSATGIPIIIVEAMYFAVSSSIL